MDPVRRITFKKMSGEGLFNYCLRNKLVTAGNKLCEVGAVTVRKMRKPVEKSVAAFLKQEKPDMIISSWTGTRRAWY